MVMGLPNEISLWQIEEIISSWRSMPQLAEFAAVRQSFCNSNGGHGLTYPEDLDEYEREVEKIAIPDGHVWLFGRMNFPDKSEGFEFKISETLYLTILSQMLSKSQFHREAEAVRQLAERSTGRGYG
jgi:hypothetical protein